MELEIFELSLIIIFFENIQFIFAFISHFNFMNRTGVTFLFRKSHRKRVQLCIYFEKFPCEY